MVVLQVPIAFPQFLNKANCRIQREGWCCPLGIILTLKASTTAWVKRTLYFIPFVPYCFPIKGIYLLINLKSVWKV